MVKDIMVIGGSGFIGTRLCLRLADRAHLKFKIIDKAISEIFPNFTEKCDVRDRHSLERAIVPGSTLIYLAAEHRDDVSPRTLYYDVNVGGAENCCLAATSLGIKNIIFTSSVAVYGFSEANTAEDGVIQPFNDYGRTKHEAEKIFSVWQQEDPQNRCVVIVRPTAVFGENNRGNVFNLFKQIASGKFLMIGPGTNKKSLAYVENVAAFLEVCIEMERGVHVYNYVDKPDLTVDELINLVSKYLGKKIGSMRIPLVAALPFGRLIDFIAFVSGKQFAVSTIRIKKFVAETTYTTKITPDIFKPEVSLQDGIERTVRFEFAASERRATE